MTYDGLVGQGDLDIVLGDWGHTGAGIANPCADLSGDGSVGQADLDIYLASSGEALASDDPLVSMAVLASGQGRDGLAAGLCDFGHQGLMHDREFSLLYNRMRYLDPVLARFMTTDPSGYTDGANRYEYEMCRAVNGRDPQGTVVVVLSGWGQSAAGMEPIRVAVENELKRRLAKYDENEETVIRFVMFFNGPAMGGYDAALRHEYQQFLARKKDLCRLEQFVAVGHSSGATTIYEEVKAGTFRQVGGYGTIPIYPAYLGLVDMWLPLLQGHVMSDLPELTYAQHFKQVITPEIRGINNHNILWVDHFSILKNATVIRSIAYNAGAAYESAVLINRAFPGVPKRWTTDRGKNQW